MYAHHGGGASFFVTIGRIKKYEKNADFIHIATGETSQRLHPDPPTHQIRQFDVSCGNMNMDGHPLLRKT